MNSYEKSRIWSNTIPDYKKTKIYNHIPFIKTIHDILDKYEELHPTEQINESSDFLQTTFWYIENLLKSLKTYHTFTRMQKAVIFNYLRKHKGSIHTVKRLKIIGLDINIEIDYKSNITTLDILDGSRILEVNSFINALYIYIQNMIFYVNKPKLIGDFETDVEITGQNIKIFVEEKGVFYHQVLL